MIIPPKLGIAMGIIISAPLPTEVRTGNNAKIVVAVVIKVGLIRILPAINTVFLISSTDYRKWQDYQVSRLLA